MYDEQREDQGNNLLGNVVIGAGLLGAGALAGNYARSVLKNRNRKVQPVNVTVEPPSGQSGTQMRDLSVLPEQTKAGVYERARQKYPDPGVGKDVQYRNPGSGGTDLSMLITDEQTGEIYRRGGGQSLRQSELTPKPNINLSKQNLGGAAPRRAADNEFLNDMNRLQKNLGEANALESKLQRQQMPGVYQSEIDASKTGLGELTWTRNRIAGSLEAPAGSVGPNVQLRDLPPADQVTQLSSQQPKPSGGERINDEKAARIARNRQRDLARVSDYMSDVLESSISEAEFTSETVPSNILKLAERAGTGNINQQDLTTFRNWGQSEFKNDPTILSEIDQNLSSFFPQQQPTSTAPSGGPKLAGYSEGPVDTQDLKHIQAAQRDQPKTLVQVKEASAPFARDARNEAIQTANDQRDLQILKHIQRNEDVDLTRYNEDVLDRRVADARDYFIRRESDQQYNYDVENQRQTAHLANQIIDELQLEGRAERNLARSQSEGAPTTITTKSGKVRIVPERYLRERSNYADTFKLPGNLRGDGELTSLTEKEDGGLVGLKAVDNARQRENLQGKRSMTGEQLEEVLLGESKVIDSNMRGKALRGGKINEEGNWFTAPGTITYAGEGGAETGDWRDASTGVRTGIKYVASGPKTPEGAASIVASEAIRKQYENQRPEPLSGPAADVARSMQTLREGMSVEPSEVPPSTQVPTINRAGYADGEVTITVPAETQFTREAADAAGPVLFTGKNKRDSAVVGTSPPLVQETVVANPQAAEYNERMAQNFLNRAIDGGLTEKQSDVYVYEPAKVVKVGSVAAPYLDTGKAAGGPEGVDASQRLGYARYTSESNPVGTPSTGAMTVGINYAELPGVIDPNRDIGRAPYRGPVQTFAERLAAATGGTATPMSMLPDRGDGRTTISMRPPAYDPRYKTAGARVEKFPAPETPTRTVYRDPNTGATFVPVNPPKPLEVKGPAPIAPDAGPFRMSVSPDPNQTYAPQVMAGKQAVTVYPRTDGPSLFPTELMLSDVRYRGGPFKFEGRERPKDEYVRPLSERLIRGNTMERFPLIRRG